MADETESGPAQTPEADPAAEKKAAPADAAKAKAAGEKTGLRRVLLAEDDPRIGLIVNTQLKALGVEVLWGKDGKKALELAEQNLPLALAVVDQMMPQMDGLTLISFLRGLEGGPELPILMLTAKHDKETVMRALKLKVNDYLSKPFEMAEFITRIKKLLSSSSRAGAEAAPPPAEPPTAEAK